MADPVDPIVASRFFADATQRKLLQDLFVSPGYSLLKELVVSRCIERQVDSINLQLYPLNEISVEKAKDALAEARFLSSTLELLDELQSKEASWYTVQLNHRR